eukprot:3636891-Pyramimonas_sp.AAC.1
MRHGAHAQLAHARRDPVEQTVDPVGVAPPLADWAGALHDVRRLHFNVRTLQAYPNDHQRVAGWPA